MRRHGVHPELTPATLAEDLAAARAELGEANVWRLANAWFRFLEDKWAIARDPVCPWSVFRRQWRLHLPSMSDQAMAKRTAPTPCEVPGCKAEARGDAWTDRSKGFPHRVCEAHLFAWDEYPVANTDVPSEAEWVAFCGSKARNAVQCSVRGCKHRASGVFVLDQAGAKQMEASPGTELPVCEWHGKTWETPEDDSPWGGRPALGVFNPECRTPREQRAV